MRDYAHSLGKKVVYGASPSDIDMNDPYSAKLDQHQIAYVKEQGLDGVNMDYEGHKPSLTERVQLRNSAELLQRNPRGIFLVARCP